MATPGMAKIRKTALRHETTWRRAVHRGSWWGGRSLRHGFLAGSGPVRRQRSNRFDRFDSTKLPTHGRRGKPDQGATQPRRRRGTRRRLGVDGVARLQRRRPGVGGDPRQGVRGREEARLCRARPPRPILAARPLRRRRRRHRGSASGAFRDPINVAMLDGIADALGAESLGLLLLTDTGEGGTDISLAPMDGVIIGCSTGSTGRSGRSVSGASRSSPSRPSRWTGCWRSISTTGMPRRTEPGTSRTSATPPWGSSPCPPLEGSRRRGGSNRTACKPSRTHTT